MDVKCERCNTEYEFDDALVSGRGTTVKCTNCGHKFKIRRSDGDFSEDFWNVTTGDGRTLVFTSLRELQRAIQGYLVERNDRLSRGGLPPKAIGQIPELAPFFEQREAAKRGQVGGAVRKTQDGLGPAAETAAHVAAAAHAPAAAQTATAVSAQPPPMRPRQATMPEFLSGPASSRLEPPPPPRTPSTLIGTGPVVGEEAFPDDDEGQTETTEVQQFTIENRLPSVPPPNTERQGAPVFDAEAAAPILQGKGRTEPPPPAPPRPTSTPPIQVATTSAAPASPTASAPPPTAPTGSRGGRAFQNTMPMNRPTPPPPAMISQPPGMGPPPSQGSHTASGSPPPRSYFAVPESSSPLPPAPRMRSLLEEIEEDRDRVRGPSGSVPDGLPRRRSVGGFIVAAVVAGCLLMLGAVWAQKNLGVTLGTKPPAPVVAVDPRVAGFLATGDKALTDGNLDLAKENFDKASALSERDPHVLLGLARLAAMRADVLWLKSRLLSQDAVEDHRITRDGLVELAATTRKAAEEAVTLAPDDPSALRAKIDALRISGDRDGARALVAKIASSSAQPETAYVLAALDLAEVEPLWPTVLERLKVASSAETGPGRARAALVFALARSGDGEGAKAEVDRLAAMTKTHPLLPLLRAFAERVKSSAAKADGGVAERPSSATPDVFDAGKPVNVVNAPTTGQPNAQPNGQTPAAGLLPTDPRQLVTQGEKARAKGDYDRARTLFSAAVDRNPNDSEALAGLAGIAYAQRDLPGARTAYKRVLAINPNYMPALVGLADVEWDSGDHGSAAKMYKDIADRYPEGAYPARVKQRAEGGG